MLKARLQVEEHDYIDNPDDGFPEIIPENLPGNQSLGNSFLPVFSYFQQQQPERQHELQEQAIASPVTLTTTCSEINGGLPENASSQSHYNRLTKSSSMLINASGTAVKPKNDELNDTTHFVRGRGILASKKDIMVPPDGEKRIDVFFSFKFMLCLMRQCFQIFIMNL